MSNLHAANPPRTSRMTRRGSRLWLIVTAIAFITAAIALTYGWTSIFGASETSQIAAKRDVQPPPQETKPARVTKTLAPPAAKSTAKQSSRKKPTVPATDQKPLW